MWRFNAYGRARRRWLCRVWRLGSPLRREAPSQRARLGRARAPNSIGVRVRVRQAGRAAVLVPRSGLANRRRRLSLFRRVERTESPSGCARALLARASMWSKAACLVERKKSFDLRKYTAEPALTDSTSSRCTLSENWSKGSPVSDAFIDPPLTCDRSRAGSKHAVPQGEQARGPYAAQRVRRTAGRHSTYTACTYLRIPRRPALGGGATFCETQSDPAWNLPAICGTAW